MFDENAQNSLRRMEVARDDATVVYPHVNRLLDVLATLAIAPFVLIIVGLLALLVRMDGGEVF